MASARFAVSREAPRQARVFVGQHLDRWGLPEMRDTATLLTSELVTNVVVHARSAPSLVVAVADGSLEVGVGDDDDRLPVAPDHHGFDLPADPDPRLIREGGRGLPLVDHLADEWGAAAIGAGKQIWFRLEAEYWGYRSACQCHADSIDRVRLQSGRFALAIPGVWDSGPA